MGIIDFFKNTKKADKGGSVEVFNNDVESNDYANNFSEEQDRFIPNIDYSEFDNFVFYGSAEQYAEDSINRILRTYPYDGSHAEKIDWRNKSTPFDLYIFDEEYPKTTGYISFTASTDSSATYNGNTYYSSSNPSYIKFEGGVGLGDYDGGGSIADGFEEANKYDLSKDRGDNLKLDLVGSGNTVEFWFKAGDNSPNDISVIFDVWNNSQTGSNSYGRFTIEADEVNEDFLLTVESGSESAQQIAFSSTDVDFNSWNQYSIRTLYNTSSNELESDLYINGNEDKKIRDSSITTLGDITGSLMAAIGSFVNGPSGSSQVEEGWGTVSGSMDEFRYWKKFKSEKHIKRNWFTNVHGGTNTDDSNTDLGVYYKFNEGITGTSSIDSTVLDYSGRVVNGDWINYPTNGNRSTGSAINDSTLNIGSEDQDPIIYANHPDVSSYKDDKIIDGQIYDNKNSTSFYNSFPNWMISEDGNEDGNLKKLTQIMSSYMDNLHLQIQESKDIKNKYYNRNGGDPVPFADRLVEEKGVVAPDIFPDAEIIESIGARSEEEEFDLSLQDIKNSIYHNIYNNIDKILKSKGTTESFRNLIHCFGIDEDIVELKLYGEDLDIEIKDEYKESSLSKNYIDLYDVDRFEGTIYQEEDPNDSDTKSYIDYDSGSLNNNAYQPFTMELNIIFPDKPKINEDSYFSTPFVSSSLFGFHKVDSTTTGNIEWVSSDDANLQVYAVRDTTQDEDAKFVLESSSPASIPTIETDLIQEVYSDERWNISVSIDPQSEVDGIVSGSDSSDYIVRFEGYSSTGDTISKSFKEEQTISSNLGKTYLTSSKRIYAGAYRQDFTGSVLEKSDVKIGSVRYWANSVPTDVLKKHSYVVDSFGSDKVVSHNLNNNTDWNDLNISDSEMLAMNWNFDNITGSNGSGEFTVTDYSSGSNSFQDDYGFLGQTIKAKHTGKGIGFPVNNTSSVDKNYLYNLEQRWPEYRDSYEDIQIKNTQDEILEKNRKLKKYSARIEKSLYDTVSKEMLDWFGTIDEFNDLIGDPVEKYRDNYKSLGALRKLFFDKVNNEPDANRFVEYYKWFDIAISQIASQLMPAGANIDSEVSNIIESHLAERPKYRHAYPSLEFSQEDPLATIDNTYTTTGSYMEEYSSSIDPVTTENIKIESGSSGNYTKVYEFLHTFGRADNPRYFVDNPSEFDDRESEVATLSGSRDDLLPNRSTFDNDSIIVNRFSSPGEEATMTRGYLNPIGEEYSVYNQLNYRNLDPRFELDSGSYNRFQLDKIEEFETSFGVDSERIPEFHKTPRNSKIESASLNSIYFSNIINTDKAAFYENYEFVYDNDFIRHAIPRTDLRYSWIKDSYLRYNTDQFDSPAINFSSFDLPYDYATGSSDIPFVSSSEEQFVGQYLDFVGVNSVYSASLDTGSLTLDVSENQDSETTYKHLNNELNGPYGYSSWKQVRNSEKKASRWLRENNFIALQNSTKAIEIADANKFTTVSPKYGFGHTKYKEPAVSEFVNNLEIDILVPGEATLDDGLGVSLRTVKIPFEGTTKYFDNQALNEALSLEECFNEPYLKIKNTYVDDFFRNPINFGGLRYNSKIYPNPKSKYFSQKRSREEFDLQLWDDKRDDRAVAQNYNSQNSPVVNESKWPLDSRGDFRNVEQFDGHNIKQEGGLNTTTNIPGELQNAYNNFNYYYKYNRQGIHLNSGSNNVDFYTQDVLESYGEITLPAQAVSIWFYLDDTSQSQYGLVSLVNDNTMLYLSQSQASPGDYVVRFSRSWTAEGALWEQTDSVASDLIEPEKWYNVVAHYNHSGSDDGAEPEIFVNASIQSIDNVFAPSGEIDNSTFPNEFAYNFYGFCAEKEDTFENPINPQDSFFDGYISDAVVYTTEGTLDGFSIAIEEYNSGLIDNYSLTSREEGESIFSVLRFGNIAEDDLGDITELYSGERRDAQLLVNTSGTSQGSYFSLVTLGNDSQKSRTEAKLHSFTNEFKNYSANSVDILGDTNYFPPLLEPVYRGQSYTRRFKYDDSDESSKNVYFAGESLWEATASNKLPFYENYDKFSENTKRAGQNKSIIPEFRMSEHVPFYFNDNGGNFLAENNSIFGLTGSKVSSSSDDAFFGEYSYSDIIREFDVVKNDHIDIGEVKKFKLKFSAIKKLLTYDGFYPMTRAYQIGELFYDSYSGSVDLNGDDATFQTLLRPLYSPGIMYNTIKSGIAVDYPIHTNDGPLTIGEAPYFKDDTEAREDQYCFDISRNTGSNTEVSGNYSFDQRLPFESIFKPENYIDNIVHDEVESYGILDSTASLQGASNRLYNLGINNFTSEVVNFFLEGSRTTSLVSDSEKDFENNQAGFKFDNNDVGKTFAMDIILKNSDADSYFSVVSDILSGGIESTSISQRNNAPTRSTREYVDINTQMFDTHQSFGIPSEQINYENADQLDSATYAAFTPPYFDGLARTRITFTPDRAGIYSISDIQNSSSVESVRLLEEARSTSTPIDFITGSDGNARIDAYTENATAPNHMQIPSSMNIDDIVLDTDQQKKWSINSKFETPILNFKDVWPAQPQFANGFGSPPAGMWLQQGSIPTGSEGLTLQITEPPLTSLSASSDGPKYAPSLYESPSGKIQVQTNGDDGDLIHITGSFGDVETFELDNNSTVSGGNNLVLIGSGSNSENETAVNLKDTINEVNGDDYNGKFVTASLVSNTEIKVEYVHSREVLNNPIISTNSGIKVSGISGGGQIDEVASLRDKLGFQDDEVKFGKIKQQQEISEAIVAIPFKEKNGDRQLFTISQQELDNEDHEVFNKMDDLMDKYNFPPIMNYKKFDSVDPFIFFGFEFTIKLSQDDLADIWQNTFEVDQEKFELEEDEIEIDLEEFQYITDSDLTDNLRWMVFKVKQQGKKNYNRVLQSSKQRRDFDEQEFDTEEGSKFFEEKYSYNWPYDYCSVVELGDMQVTVEMDSE